MGTPSSPQKKKEKYWPKKGENRKERDKREREREGKHKMGVLGLFVYRPFSSSSFLLVSFFLKMSRTLQYLHTHAQ